MKKAILILVILILQAVSDAYFFTGNKPVSKLLECFYIFGFLVLPALITNRTFKYISALLVFYLFLRMSVYDIAFNLAAGLDINYVGKTSFLYDTAMSKLSVFSLWFNRVLCMAISVIIYIKILNDEKNL